MEITSKEMELLTSRRIVAPIGIVVAEGGKALGKEIIHHVSSWQEEKGQSSESLEIENSCPRFSSGDSKGLITSSVRGKDLYFIVDVGNYSCQYDMFGKKNAMSPDDHIQDLKRLIQATGGKAHRINVIMPLLYGGRQHRRNFRESLDCSFMLQELHNMGVSNVLTFDAHDPRVQNAIPLTGFDNVIPYYQVIKTLMSNIDVISKDRFMVVSPDEGAMSRNMYYASVLGVDLGMYYKLRDYSRLVNGRNPIIKHEYLGASVVGKDIFITDDIISSGESMLSIAYDLKDKGASKIYCYATYPMFTNGLEFFDKAYDEGVISGVLGTNLSYNSEDLTGSPWYHPVDVSKYVAYIIMLMNSGISISNVLNPHVKIRQLLDKNYKTPAI